MRDRLGLTVVEGPGAFVAACDAGAVRAVIHCPRLLTAAVAAKLVRYRKRDGVPVVKVSPERFRVLSETPRASGVAAIVARRCVSLGDLDPAAGPFRLVLESVRSPGNLGTLFRTAAAFGAAGVVLVGPRVDPFDPAAVRASMGAVFRLDVARVSLAGLRHWKATHRVPLVGTSPAAAERFDRVPFPRPSLIALGDERAGLSPGLLAACDRGVSIPMRAGCDSLNLGVACGLVMHAAAHA